MSPSLLSYALISVAFLEAAAADICRSPASYGAYPDDGNPDNTGLANALNDGPGCVELEAGVYQVNPPTSGYTAIHVTQDDVELRGTGAGSILRMTGSYTAGWKGIVWVGDRGAARTFAMDGLGLTGTVYEQSHLIQVGEGNAPVVDFTAESLLLSYSRGGDCLRAIGYDTSTGAADSMIRRFRLVHSTFLFCDRSGFGPRGVEDLLVDGNYFVGAYDQEIDLENSGASHDARWVITRNFIMRNAATSQGDSAIGLASTAQKLQGLVLTDNVIVNGGIWLANASGGLIAGNVIVGRVSTQAEGLIYVFRAIDGLTISNNWVRRIAGGTAGPVITVSQNNGAQPTDVRIDSNTLLQDTGHVGVDLDSSTLTTVSNNRIILSHASASAGVRARSVLNTADLRIAGNTIKGVATSGVRLENYPGTLARVLVNDNILNGQTTGVSCASSGVSAVLVDGNIIEPASGGTDVVCTAATLGTNL